MRIYGFGFPEGAGVCGKALRGCGVHKNDLKTLPNFHSMPMTFLPYITSLRNVFLDGGETYQGDADVAVNAGFLNDGNLSEAKHGVYYAWSGTGMPCAATGYQPVGAGRERHRRGGAGGYISESRLWFSTTSPRLRKEEITGEWSEFSIRP